MTPHRNAFTSRHQKQKKIFLNRKTLPIFPNNIFEEYFRQLFWTQTAQIFVENIPRKKRPYNEIRSSSIPHAEIESISTTHTKTKTSSMITLKPSDFWPAYKNEVSFDHPHSKSQSISTLKTSNFWPCLLYTSPSPRD